MSTYRLLQIILTFLCVHGFFTCQPSVAAPLCTDFFTDSSSPVARATEDVLSRQIVRLKKSITTHKIDLEGYKNALRLVAARDPIFARLLSLLQSNQVTFAMDRSPLRRLDIIKTGFHNIHETANSAGAYQPEVRSFVESQYLGLSKEEYEALPNSVKPKSMYLLPLAETGIHTPPTHYFDGKGDTWIFKRNAIKNNTRFVVGDSYDRALQTRLTTDTRWGAPIEEFPLELDSVADFVLPLNLLITAAPFYYEQLKSSNTWRFVDVNSPRIKKVISKEKKMMAKIGRFQVNAIVPDFNEAFFARFPELEPYKDSFLFDPWGNYVEGLYFGPLDLSKVQKLIVRQNPPTSQEMAMLKAHGIEVEILTDP
jgi:hypothetical protein